MSLLLLLLQEQSYKHKLSDLFDIKQGIAIKPGSNLKGKYRYKAVFPSMMNSPFKVLDSNELNDFYTDTELSEEKLLTKDDYLIACKGLIKGFSLFQSESCLKSIKNEKMHGVVASNHLIILRPKPITHMFISDTYFLHNLLDMVVERITGYLSDNKGKKQQYITIADLKNINIGLHWNSLDEELQKIGPDKLEEFKKVFGEKIEAFQQLFADWDEKLKAFNEANTKLKEFNTQLQNQIRVTLPFKPADKKKKVETNQPKVVIEKQTKPSRVPSIANPFRPKQKPTGKPTNENESVKIKVKP